MRVALLVAGPKGANFLRNFNSSATIELVVSYRTKGVRQDAHAEIQSLCHAKGYDFRERAEGQPEVYRSVDLVLLVGWQYLAPEVDDRFVVFHDSLLPKLRGFNPTVSALIAGETEAGVTAFSPTGGQDGVADSGPIFGQEKIQLQYPTTVGEVYDRLGRSYCRLADRVVQASSSGTLLFSPQESREATYSIWRDEDDYRIDWTKSADAIRRLVDAVGWPYMGAKTCLKGREIRIDAVELRPDITFIERCPGKIWSLAAGSPEVVCGSGMLRLVKTREVDGSPVNVSTVRTRLT
jgi:methionyl-tRNA formyltransferase